MPFTHKKSTSFKASSDSKEIMDQERIKKLIRELIIEIGEDPTREGLRGTPERIARAYEELFAGYDSDSELSVQFSEESETVIAKDLSLIHI